MPSLPRPPFRKTSRPPDALLLATVTALLAVVTVLAGCATQPASQPNNRWTQLGAGGHASLRAIVAAESECPTAIVDGAAERLLPRAKATPAARTDARPTDNPAFEPEFAVTSCELALPPSTLQASIDGQAMALPKAETRRIVVVGDTGCRIQVPASGAATPIQDCASETDWPWQRIAAAAARTRPDLVIHVGDYHYREYCYDPTLCAPLRGKGVVIGYGWAGWNADFFTPAAPLLAAAPWIVVRGNHENCDRGGAGWMRFLSPLPYQACGNQAYKTASQSVLANNLTADAYRIDLDGRLTLIVADNAGHQDYLAASATPPDVEIFRRTLTALWTVPATRTAWLIAHRPVWYDLLAAASRPNAFQVALRDQRPENLQFIFAGHEHAFETINFAPAGDLANYPAGRPAQVIAGGSGTQLEAFDPQSPFYEGPGGVGSKDRSRPDERPYDGVRASSGIVLNRYSFLLLERIGESWTGTLMDPDGTPISRCRLNGEEKEVACTFPGR